MDHFTHCPMPSKGGADCWGEPHPASRFGLCVSHWRQAVEDWCSDQPTTSIRCDSCATLNTVDTVEMASAVCHSCRADISAPALVAERPERDQLLNRINRDEPGVVYYLRFGDRIKIGFSAHLSTRVLVLPHDEIVAVEPGSITIERARHRQFAAQLVSGQREWFSSSPLLESLMLRLRVKHGDPTETAAAIAKGRADIEKTEVMS